MINVFIAGDFCPRFRILEKINCDDTEDILQDFLQFTNETDLSILNLECPVLYNEKKVRPISKHGPCLKSTIPCLSLIKNAGFNVVTLANNHIRDYGDEGIMQTIQSLDNNQIEYVGAGNNIIEASKIFYHRKENECIAIINCCENEFSVATDQSAGANPLDTIKLWYNIKEAKKNANYVLVIIHGGHENFQYPSERMKTTYRYFIDVGADAVINHHQHCYSGYEIYNEKPIFYGLGNFCFDGNRANGSSIWNEGFCVKLKFSSSVEIEEIVPYIQCDDTPIVKIMSHSQKELFFQNLENINNIIQDDELLNKKIKEFYHNSSLGYKITMTPYSNDFLRRLAAHGIIPTFLSRKRLLNILNYVKCESHRDRYVFLLNELLDIK